jgi:hypothetical protein
MAGLVGASMAAMTAAAVQAAFVEPGWDLLHTAPGTTFAGQPFVGVPLGAYDFGGTIGVKNVGNADTIVQRLATADVPAPPGSDTIPIELVALQLVSVNPFFGPDLAYITLQSARSGADPPPGPASIGEMDIHFANDLGGTFDSFFDVFFDVRVGALNGPIQISDQLRLSSQGTPWDRVPPPGALVIQGVNLNLNGNDNAADFWPGPINESHPSGAMHNVVPATPEPATFGVAAGLVFFGAVFAWLRAKRHNG